MIKSVEFSSVGENVYSPPTVSIIDIFCESPLCQSGIIDDDKDNEGYGGENDFEW